MHCGVAVDTRSSDPRHRGTEGAGARGRRGEGGFLGPALYNSIVNKGPKVKGCDTIKLFVYRQYPACI